MNYLAHIFLSGDNPEIRIGNFIGDYVKGAKHERYTQGVQKGILLHRKIDSFTDSHHLVKKSSNLLRHSYNRYSGVVVDVFYDHFLAANWDRYSDEPLSKYVTGVHSMLMKNYFKLPGEVRSFLPFLIKSRRLENYQHLDGVEKALTIMTKYTSMPPYVEFAMNQLNVHYDEFQHDFDLFFGELQTMVALELNEQHFSLEQSL
jgi:acyl carrier protein phosphodiesterase